MVNWNVSFTRSARCALFAATTFISACGAAMINTTPAAKLEVASGSAAIDTTVRSIMAIDVSPGIAVVAVRGTSIIYAQGVGYADLETRSPFTNTTELYIASTTKSFTGLAAAILDGEGRLLLNEPVTKYLPALTLHAPLRADSISMLSLLTHTHGISGDGPVTTRLAYTGDYSGDSELVALFASHKPATRGHTYQYSNIGYNIAALAMDAAADKSWRTVLDQRIFKPLGMHNTSTYISAFPRDRYAMPYAWTRNGFERIRFGKFDNNMQSAGGIVTTPADMGRWLIANINNGWIDEHQAIRDDAFKKAHRNYVKLDLHSHGEHQIGYTLGWRVAEARRVVSLKLSGATYVRVS